MRAALGMAFLLTPLSAAYGIEWTAQEVMIPMRDGVKLHTVYFIPKGKTGPFPILLERTPYGSGDAESGPQRTTDSLEQAGYIFAFQDVRGTGASQGTFVNVRPISTTGAVDETTDTYDTVDYLIRHVPQNSKRVGLWGISYPGFYAGVAGVRNHPAIKAISPQAPVNDWFLGDDFGRRGALFQQEAFDFLMSFGAIPGAQINVDRQGKSAYDFFLSAGAPATWNAKFFKDQVPFWNDLIAHDTYDTFWKERALWRSFRSVNCPVLTVGGLFDKEDMWGAIHLFQASQRLPNRDDNIFVYGPWAHGQWADPGATSLGDLQFGQPTSEWFQKNVEFPFFERYLRGNQNVPRTARAAVFETGLNRWRLTNQWPPKAKPQSLFLAPNRGLAWGPPPIEGSAQYTYDPSVPTPYLADFRTSQGAPYDWLARNQAFLRDRPDAAEFTLAPLAKDLRIGGPIHADLWVTTTGTDADFVVQVLDVYPSTTTDTTPSSRSMAGYEMMVRGEIMRARFRKSWESPEAIQPGKPTHVTFDLNDVLHTFRAGHQIKIRILSSWFPIADRNPNQFISRAALRDDDYRPANISILLGGEHASRINVGVLNPAP